MVSIILDDLAGRQGSLNFMVTVKAPEAAIKESNSIESEPKPSTREEEEKKESSN
jgi:hypothetical protein